MEQQVEDWEDVGSVIRSTWVRLGFVFMVALALGSRSAMAQTSSVFPSYPRTSADETGPAYPTTAYPVSEHLAPLPEVRESEETSAVESIPNELEPLPSGVVHPAEGEDSSEADAWWFSPTWCPHWESSIELGLNGSDGNSEAFNFQVGASLKRETDQHRLALSSRYNKSSTESIETQNNAFGEARYDRLLGYSRWTLFTFGTLEYDEFRAFDLRLAINSGVGYQIISNDLATLTGRFGSGVSHEIGGPVDDYVPEALFGFDLEYQITARQKMTAKSDYFPDWGEFSEYRIHSDIGWEVLLDEATNLSLKLAVADRYDSTPNGLERNDVNYSLLLLWRR